MDHNRKDSAGSSPIYMGPFCAWVVPVWTVALVAVLVLLPLVQCFGFDIWQVPTGQPEQIKSKVDYDSRLADRFFEIHEWSCPFQGMHGVVCRDGKPPVIHKVRDPTPTDNSELEEWSCPDGCKECAVCRNGRRVVKNTAKCFSTSFNVKHDVGFCEARLFDPNVIEFLLHHHSPAFDDSLLVRISDGKFTCQYWIIRDSGAVRYTTKRQKLTLDKKVYRKGDVIKGRIDFECLSEFRTEYAEKFGKRQRTIKVYGVFKTILN